MLLKNQYGEEDLDNSDLGKGLYVSNLIVKRLGGIMKVKSIPNQFTQFKITLPEYDSNLNTLGVKTIKIVSDTDSSKSNTSPLNKFIKTSSFK